jgi:hypothetical protein
MCKKLLKATLPLVLCAAFAACGAPSPAPAPAAPAAPEYEYAQEAPSPNPPAYPYDAVSDVGAQSLPILAPDAMGGKKLAYTVELSLQTRDFSAGMRKLLTTTADMGGYVVSADVTGRDLHAPEWEFERYANYTFRLPSDRLAEYLAFVEDSYNLWRLTQYTRDSTEQYQRNELALPDLREQEESLKADIAAGGDAETLAQLERQLADTQASIARLTAEQARIEESVVMSDVNVMLYEVIVPEEQEPEPELTFGQRLRGTAQGSAKGLLAFGQGLVIVLVAVGPTLLILAALGAAALLIFRRVKRRRAAQPAKEAPRLQPTPQAQEAQEAQEAPPEQDGHGQ